MNRCDARRSERPCILSGRAHSNPITTMKRLLATLFIGAVVALGTAGTAEARDRDCHRSSHSSYRSHGHSSYSHGYSRGYSSGHCSPQRYYSRPSYGCQPSYRSYRSYDNCQPRYYSRSRGFSISTPGFGIFFSR